MDDLRVLPPHNGLLAEEAQLSSPSPSSNPQPTSISAKSWRRADQVINEMICRIQPTVLSEHRRKAVVNYVQNLIKGYIGSEVFPFGSVPLKTYLPDGDIDLTALSHLNGEDVLANEVRAVLEGMEQNKEAEFEVKDVQYIHAEVKLIKCLVQNIVVDISFNQLGGLCTLCFLEQVDRLIGKEHLFKRSIILIKAWCYYESRILGAHHGLISTYALETLVLFIFHLFHSSLHGPLEVLYWFLDYFSKFDWDNYGISVNGPFILSSLPDIVAEVPETDGDKLLLNKDFLRYCVDSFSVPLKVNEMHMRSFPQKYLNIVDPLKESNNLGRSVNKGNFHRIRSAFGLGARKLGHILALLGEGMEDELKKFFLNTLERHGSGRRPDVQDYFPNCNFYSISESGSAPSNSGTVEHEEIEEFLALPSVESHCMMGNSINDDRGMLCEKINHLNISGSEKKSGINQLECCFASHQTTRKEETGSDKKYESEIHPKSYFMYRPEQNKEQNYDIFGPSLSEVICTKERNVVSSSRLAGDAKDLATSWILSTRGTNELCKPSTAGNGLGAMPSGRSHLPHQSPYLYFDLSGETQNIVNLNLDESKQSTDSVLSSGLDAYPSDTLLQVNDSGECEAIERDSVSHSGCNLDVSKSLSDLSGDYESHFQCLQFGRWCQEYAHYGPFVQLPLQMSSPHRNKSFWNARRPTHMKQSMFPCMNVNGVTHGPLFTPGYYPVSPPLLSGTFGLDEMPKPRGTGTYFPNMNHHSYKDRPFVRGRNSASSINSQLHRHRNGRYVLSSDVMINSENGGQELQSQAPASQLVCPGVNGDGKSNQVDMFSYNRCAGGGFSPINGGTHRTDRLEFGSFGPGNLDQGRQLDSGALQHSLGSGLVLRATMQIPGSSMRQERSPHFYHLKNEDDFPPLSS